MANQSTSIAALLRAAPEQSTLEKRIIEELRIGPATRQDLADKFERGVNSLCAPVKAMIKAGLIEEFDRVIGKSGSKQWLLRIREAA
ncbi:MAG TPA: hypothetical protein VM783_17935 [Candidatus Acidoferrum sp.]|nr:hypothetical protein [Candidatus Acidoferrum sp.]